MIKDLLVVVALLLARGAAATTCTVDGLPCFPSQLEPSVTSFCSDVLDTRPSTSVPTPLTAFLLDWQHIDFILLLRPRSSCNDNDAYAFKLFREPSQNVTVFTTPSLSTATVQRTTITVSETARTATITITAPAKTDTVSETAHTATITITAPAKTDTVFETAPTVTITASGRVSNVTLPPSTVTLTPSTITLSPDTVTLTPSTITPSPDTITLTPSTITLSPSTVTLTESFTAGTPTCTLAAPPPAYSMCAINALYGGGSLFQISNNTAASLSACTELCIANSNCVTISFDGTYCGLYFFPILQLEEQMVVAPVGVGVAGSAEFYDLGCLSCSTPGCPPTKKRREIARREADVGRREKDLKRRMLAVVDRESALAVDR